jgi:hypothetical protein
MKKVLLSLLCLTITMATVSAQETTKPATGRVKSVPASQSSTMPVAQTLGAPPPAAPAPTPVDANAGKFKFKEETHDYGEVPEGPLAEYDFEFKNVGKKPIIISEAHGSCGCTVPKWPTDPILPKHKGVIHVSYNTNGRVGQINKDVYITSNAQQSLMKLHITGNVKAKPDAVKPAPPVPPAPPKN